MSDINEILHIVHIVCLTICQRSKCCQYLCNIAYTYLIIREQPNPGLYQ